MADNVFRVTLVQSFYGQENQNVLHFSGPSSDPLQLSALADEMESGWIFWVKKMQVPQLVYVNIRVRLLASQFATFDKAVNIPGTAFGIGEDIPFVANIIRIRTPIIGKHGRGRVYASGIPKGVTTNGLLRQDHLSNWNDNLTEVRARFLPGGSSTFRIGVAPKVNPTGGFIEATQIEMSNKMGVQRRRNIGVGA